MSDPQQSLEDELDAMSPEKLRERAEKAIKTNAYRKSVGCTDAQLCDELEYLYTVYVYDLDDPSQCRDAIMEQEDS